MPYDVDIQFGDKCEGQVSCSFHEGIEGARNSFLPLVLEGGELNTFF